MGLIIKFNLRRLCINKYNKTVKEQRVKINKEIRAREIRLVGDRIGNAEPKNYGVISLEEALKIAEQEGLDLVEISPLAKPPVVKLIDYGKYKYQEQKKLNEAKKKQVQILVKELKLRPGIDTHDLQIKLKKATEFLKDGDKVRFIMQFRGRELAHKDLGMNKFKQIIESFQASMENLNMDQAPAFERNSISCLISWSKKVKKA